MGGEIKPAADRVPNLADYDEACRVFNWEEARSWLDGLPGARGLNMAHEAVDRHVAAGRGEKTALRFLGRAGSRGELGYADLARRTCRFASALEYLGVGAGDRVFALCGRIPELYVAALGTLKRRAVFCPLFSAFGPEPVRERMALGEGRALVTSSSLYHRKVAAIRDALPALRNVLLVDDCDPATVPGGVLLRELLEEGDPSYELRATRPEDPALLHFTSGTTGRPKGALHVHEAIVAHHATARFALDLKPDDTFWCTADPGWVTGTSYGILAPLSHGVTSIVDEAEFDPERWYRILQDERVTVWYTAPTAIRMLMKCGAELPRKFDLSALRFVASVGEPLNPEAVRWGEQVLGIPIHDNWWQTETGAILVANLPSVEIRPGSMGLPLPGIRVAVVAKHDVAGSLEFVDQPDTTGELAIRKGWPSMFRAYLNEEERYRQCFVGDWYLSGDLVRQDADGYLWFVGRADDLIKSSGHLIGPFEVESALLEHPAVAEAGVFGKPDPLAGAVVKAVVELNDGFEPTDALRRKLLAHARQRLGPVVAPKEVDFTEELPKTRSGKIMRRVLRARELGLPEADLSALGVSGEKL